LRSFTIQGSWNYRTMIGGGFAFAMLPVLRWVSGSDRKALTQGVTRHLEHFNAHPYMASLALGATARLELDESAPEEIQRFKVAVRGPLGSLGDTLIWMAWRPTATLVALVVAVAGGPPWLAVAVFLLLYNSGHLLLRSWGFVVGLRYATKVGERLERAGLSQVAVRISALGVLALGLVLGLVAGRGLEGDPARALWLVPMFVGGFVGVRFGRQAWKPLVLGLAGVMGLLLIIGGLR
jgi:mannose/fructose/N-acetylgalactosamine-specific phosphotransferase system component IID